MKNDEKVNLNESYSVKVVEMRHMIDEAISKSIISEDNLKDLLASSWADLHFSEKQYNELLALHKQTSLALGIHAEDINTSYKERKSFLELLSESNNTAAEAILKGIRLRAKEIAQKGAIALHNKPGGSRDKQRKIRDIWATGKYTSRDICAEEECAGLGMSFSAARKALRNTPDPN